MLGMKTAGSTILFPFSICRDTPTWFHIAVQQSSVEGFCLAAISKKNFHRPGNIDEQARFFSLIDKNRVTEWMDREFT
jgi:hypothetical protein